MRWLLLAVLAPCFSERLDAASPSLLQSQSELRAVEVVLHPKTSEWFERCVGCAALVLTVCLTVYLKHVVEDYEEKSPPDAAPWYCDERIILQVGGGFLAAWLLIGLVTFTLGTNFVVLGETRKLSLLEAFYVCAEILTTVGYGDITPSSYSAQAFCAVYTVVGCSLIAVVFSLLFNFWFGTQRHLVPLTHPAVAAAASHSRSRYQGALNSLRPMLLSLAMGTVFFAYYPGENKTPWEAFYMSIQTLTTVGFGDLYPVTKGGRAFATLWMLLGVSSAANMIVTLTDSVLKYRKRLKSEHLSKELLRKMSMDGSGKVSKSDFLCYELTRRGLCETEELAEILAFFKKLDCRQVGYLDFKDFEALVTLQS